MSYFCDYVYSAYLDSYLFNYGSYLYIIKVYISVS
jgi:hypothetical protein